MPFLITQGAILKAAPGTSASQRRVVRVAPLSAHSSASASRFVGPRGPLLAAQQKTEPVAEAPDARLARRHVGLVALAGLTGALSAGAAMPGAASAALSAYDITGKGILDLSMELGNAQNENVFVPSELSFEQGRVYRLRLTNPSSVEHYFTALGFASKVFTIIVQVDGTEVKGAVTELALDGGKEMTWIFIPQKPGRYPLICPIKGHEESMRGMLTITPAAGKL